MRHQAEGRQAVVLPNWRPSSAAVALPALPSCLPAGSKGMLYVWTYAGSEPALKVESATSK